MSELLCLFTTNLTGAFLRHVTSVSCLLNLCEHCWHWEMKYRRVVSWCTTGRYLSASFSSLQQILFINLQTWIIFYLLWSLSFWQWLFLARCFQELCAVHFWVGYKISRSAKAQHFLEVMIIFVIQCKVMGKYGI